MALSLGRVLVIEDDPDIANILAVALPPMGATGVVVEATGTAGLERGLAEPFDLVLVDLLLPGKDGFDVVRGLRATIPPAQCAMVFLTSAARDVDARVVRLSGADGLIRKPFTLKSLARDLALILASRSATA